MAEPFLTGTGVEVAEEKGGPEGVGGEKDGGRDALARSKFVAPLTAAPTEYGAVGVVGGGVSDLGGVTVGEGAVGGSAENAESAERMSRAPLVGRTVSNLDSWEARGLGSTSDQTP